MLRRRLDAGADRGAYESLLGIRRVGVLAHELARASDEFLATCSQQRIDGLPRCFPSAKTATDLGRVIAAATELPHVSSRAGASR